MMNQNDCIAILRDMVAHKERELAAIKYALEIAGGAAHVRRRPLPGEGDSRERNGRMTAQILAATSNQ